MVPARGPETMESGTQQAKGKIDILKRISYLLTLLAVAFVLTACEAFDSYGPGAGHFNTVIVDAGHGGHDRGARSVTGQAEKEVALDTSKRLARILRSKGFRVIETRSGDTFIPLGKRVDISNRSSGAIFVSIHYNWARRSSAQGLEVYYFSERSRRLAANILSEIKKAYPTVNRGVKTARFHVLRNNRRPAVLCELGFLSNPSDNRYVQNPTYRQRLAERIAAGIIDEKLGRDP